MNIKVALGITVSVGILAYTIMGDCNTSMIPVQNHDIEAKNSSYIVHKSLVDSYKSINNIFMSTEEKIEIIHSFVSQLLEHTEDMEPQFSETIDKYFWDLV